MQLKWVTLTETSNSHLNLQRSVWLFRIIGENCSPKALHKARRLLAEQIPFPSAPPPPSLWGAFYSDSWVILGAEILSYLAHCCQLSFHYTHESSHLLLGVFPLPRLHRSSYLVWSSCCTGSAVCVTVHCQFEERCQYLLLQIYGSRELCPCMMYLYSSDSVALWKKGSMRTRSLYFCWLKL